MPLTFQVAIFTAPIYHARMAAGAPTDGAARHAVDKPAGDAAGLRRTLAVVAAGLLIAGLGWPALLARLPLGLYLKNQLHASALDVAAFWGISTLAWYVKPFAGLLCDGLPLFGTRRRGFLLVGGLAGAALWLALGVVPLSYRALLLTVAALNVALMLISTAVGGLLVEEGQRRGATGRLSSLRMAVDGVIALIAGPLGGWLAGRALGWTAGVGAAIVFSLVPATLAWVREPRGSAPARPSWSVIWQPVRIAFRSRSLWIVLGFIFIAYLPPGFQTALFYRQQDALKFSAADMGNLQLVGGAGALIGAALYVRYCRRFALRLLLPAGIVMNVISTIIYVWYDGWAIAVAITALSAVLGTLAMLPLFDLAARAIPGGGESFGYALILSAQNVAALAVAEPLGAYLYSDREFSFAAVVGVNTAVTAAVLLLVPLLPAALLAGRDT
jgi:hypothetical protein